MPTTAGTQAGMYPSPGIKSTPFRLHQSIVKDLGDHPIPLIEYVLLSFAE